MPCLIRNLLRASGPKHIPIYIQIPLPKKIKEDRPPPPKKINTAAAGPPSPRRLKN